MKPSTLTSVLLLTFLLASACFAQTPAIKIEKLEQAPGWFDPKGTIKTSKVIEDTDSTGIYEYNLFDGRKLFCSTIDYGSPDDYDDGDLLHGRESRLTLVGADADTVLTIAGRSLWVMAVSPDSHFVAIAIGTVVNEDFDQSDIVLLDIEKGTQTKIFRNAGHADAAFNDDSRLLAFADFGNVYLYDTEASALEPAFTEGGSLLVGSNWPTQNICIRNIQWEPGAYTFAIAFKPNVFQDSTEYYQINLNW